ncbi:MAG: globin [Thermus sp.]
MPTDKSLGEFYRKAQVIFDQLPPETRFRFEDGKVIGRNRDFLLSLTESLVKGFYDTLFAHPTTRAIFQEGERPQREKTLQHWWRRTVEGPFNAQYFAWQTLVGLVHVKRRVTNAMMAAMWGFVVGYVAQEAERSLRAEEARALERAFQRIATTVTALIGEGYMQNLLEALSRATGKSVEELVELAVREAEHHLDLLRSS